MTTYKEAMREAYAAGWRAHVGGARDNQDAHFETFFAEHLKRVAPPPEEIKPGTKFPLSQDPLTQSQALTVMAIAKRKKAESFPMRVTNFQAQSEIAALNFAEVERMIHASFAIPEEVARGSLGVTGVRTGRFSASNPPTIGAWLDDAPGEVTTDLAEDILNTKREIGGKLASGPTDEELKAWYDNGRDLNRDVVVVATTDKDQDGNAIEREIPRSQWVDAPIVDATPDTESPNGSD
jgi:hypothetical protein